MTESTVFGSYHGSRQGRHLTLINAVADQGFTNLNKIRRVGAGGQPLDRRSMCQAPCSPVETATFRVQTATLSATKLPKTAPSEPWLKPREKPAAKARALASSGYSPLPKRVYLRPNSPDPIRRHNPIGTLGLNRARSRQPRRRFW